MKPCVFCGGPAGGKEKSREDFWPKWLREHPTSKKAAQRKSMTSRYIRIKMSETGVSQGDPQYKKSGRSRIFDTAKGICRTCNNTWLSGIQASTRQALKPIFFGERSDLLVAEQHILATWTMMTALTIDLGFDYPPGGALAACRKPFMETRRPTFYSPTLFVGRTDRPEHAAIHHTVPCAFYLEVWPFIDGPGAILIFSIGSLVFVAAINGLLSVEDHDWLKANGMHLFPTRSDINLETMPAVGEHFLDRAFERVVASQLKLEIAKRHRPNNFLDFSMVKPG